MHGGFIIYQQYTQSDVVNNCKCEGIILNNQSISLDQSSLWYSFLNQVQCILRNDQDVYLMFQCQRMLQCEFIDLEISRSVPTNNVVDGPQSPVPMNCNNNGLCLAEIENQIRPTKTYLTELWRQFIHSEDQVFKGAKEFKEDLIKYSISLGFSFDYVYNDKDHITAKCSRKEEDGCEWRVQASKNRANGLFYIRKLNNIHTCSGRYRTRKNKKLNSSLVASLVMDKIRDNPHLRPNDIVSDFKGSYGLDISYWNAWFVREVARTKVHGSDKGSYAILMRYVEAINETNTGSRCVIEFDNETRRFRRLFVAFGACIEGFERCRPLLALDGNFLKSKYKGTLLAATIKDGDQDLYSFALAVVDNENFENWRWFVDQLWYILGNGRVITFISDRNEGLINAIKAIFPHSLHGYCLKHIQTIIQSKYPGQNCAAFRTRMVFLFTKCAYALTTESFNYWFTKLNNEGGDMMKRFFKKLPLENWANSRFYGWRYGEMCSNIAESFNAWIVEQRHFPIT